MQEKVSIIVVQYGQKFPSLGSRLGITRRNLVLPNRDPRDGNFRPYLTPMKDTYISWRGSLEPRSRRDIFRNEIFSTDHPTCRVHNEMFVFHTPGSDSGGGGVVGGVRGGVGVPAA